jgi:dihydropteroate synthase
MFGKMPNTARCKRALSGSNNRATALVSIIMRERIWTIGEHVFNVSQHGLIMGVLNVTPDSFSDGGDFFTAEKAIERGLVMAAEGAHIIDVGGESTRPGSEPVTAGEELGRVIPVIKNLRAKIDVPISIDTSKADVARAAIEAGASIVNDVTGGRGDERMLPVVAETESAFIIMHMQGIPRTMQIRPQYTNVVEEISDFFRQQYARAIGLNIDPMVIAFDPGIGFGKTLDHNLELLAHLERLHVHDRPLVVGVSRKSFLGKLIGSGEINDRLVPGVALTSLLRASGADVFRVHDVKENVHALRVTESILQRAK